MRRRRFRGTSPLNDPWLRGLFAQGAVALVLVLVLGWFLNNALENLRRANITSGFDFLWHRAGFEISQTLVPFAADDTYARAFLVGLLNTLLVAVVGIVLSTVIGFVFGVARLSKNALIAGIATVYIEVLRNVPVLLQLLFWYRAVLAVLPAPRQAIPLPFGSFLSNRGLLLPRLVAGEGFGTMLLGIAVAVAAVALLAIWARRRQMRTGRPFPTGWVVSLVFALLVALSFVASGMPVTAELPELQGFNFVGGLHVLPEFTALILGLTLYTAAFIAEVVRAGILGVPHGQTEAAYALGFHPRMTLRLVVIPQAMRIIIPPLTNQYLNLTKNSSLAVAVAYPDLVSVLAGTILNQTGQAIEAIALTMAVYLAISLATSLLMNWFNQRVALVER